MTLNRENKALDRIFLALDNMDTDGARSFLKRPGLPTKLKIGMELFYQLGPLKLKQFILEVGPSSVFLDLKLHDIPNTVAQAIKSLGGLPIDYLTLHLCGGIEMLLAARESQRKYLPNCQLVGVSYLTSLSLQDFSTIWGVPESVIPQQFEKLFELGKQAQIPCLVLSPQELKLVTDWEKLHTYQFVKITPGVRFPEEINAGRIDDQSRPTSWQDAFKNGADFIVMGRSLTQATNLDQRLQQITTYSV